MNGAGRLLSAGWLLAQRERSTLESLGSNFRGENAKLEASDLLLGLAILGALAVGGYAASRLARRGERLRIVNDPRSLFKSLCKAHRLDRRARSVLRRLAAQQQLLQTDRAALLFVEPDRFSPERLKDWPPQEAALVAELRARLFGQV
jgi:hypothetical protein